ncbi:hypothetical protein F5Y16DRAFT_268114 [Xylariaceae sp. FL0255]|nr:hypothetical protein F5Y16DRAFT_268114 [Xylariaceae sp. FL0255]
MCPADLSLVTMEWKDTTSFPTANFHTTHECTNWDKLYEWQKKRARNIWSPDFLYIHILVYLIRMAFTKVWVLLIRIM